MSQEKAQLIAPLDTLTVPGLNVSGVATASSFVGDVTGTASSVTKGANLVVGVMTASSFVGDVTGNVSGITSNTDNLYVGILTATTFAGDFTGIGSGLTGTPNVVSGVMTATSFVGNFTGVASGITGTPNIMVGVLTGTAYNGDGSNLTGAGSTAFIRQSVTATDGTSTINLNDGNVIYFTHTYDTTIAFSNVGTVENITIIRTLTDKTITWPGALLWNNDTTPTLINNPRATAGQVFHLNTADAGTTWYGYEEVSSDPSTHSLYVWGGNTSGQLGINNATPSGIEQVPGTTWSSLAHGRSDCAGAIKTDGTLWVWGANEHGTLGQNDVVFKSSPVQIPGATWNMVSVGGDQAAISSKTDGTLWTWGRNQKGQLGHNEQGTFTEMKSSPVQVPGTTWGQVSMGGNDASSIKTDGTLWVWGAGLNGELAQNDRTPGYSSPVQIPGTTWSTVKYSDSEGWAFATKTDGTLWAWGNGLLGKLAQNNTTRYSSPVQVPGTTWGTDVRSLSVSFYHGAAIKTDGTLWSWGYNNQGALGQNNDIHYSSPVQIPGTTWISVSCGKYNTLAVKTDNTLWSWGYAGQGAQGPGNPTCSSPIQIPGTAWATDNHAMTRNGLSVFALKAE